MVIKEKFDLLKGVENVLKISKATLNGVTIDKGPRTFFVMLELMKGRISHYTKDEVFGLLSNISKREVVKVVKLPTYSLPVSYNIPTKSMIINLSPFGIDEISTNKPGVFNLYALIVYGITFSALVSKKAKVSDSYSPVISSYILSLLIRLFGKQYGLLGSFSTEIPKLKFLTNVYILDSFFGIKDKPAYKRAATASSYNYKEIEDKLSRYNFADINDFILSLSEFEIMPNMNRHVFASRFLRQFGFNMLPALEDCSRFIATIATSDIKSSNVVPTFLYKYNEKEYAKILEITRSVFKRGK
jgi:hypothetical protein